MITKIRQIIAAILALCLMVLLMACADTKEQKWVLTYEKQQYSDEYDNSSVIHEGYFEYDASGKMISEKIVYGSTEFVSSDFIYDEEGKLTNKSGIHKDYLNGESPYSYSYTYDKNGNCVSEIINWDTAVDSLTYSYNKYGDIVESHSIYKGDTYKLETNYYITRVYEDDICVQSEVKKEIIDEIETKTIFSIEKYTYDSNGNKITELHYSEIESAEDAENPVFIKGRFYKLDWRTEYTYELLDDVAIIS